MSTDDRKPTHSDKSATQPQDESIRDLPDRKESDRQTKDENVKGGSSRQRPALE